MINEPSQRVAAPISVRAIEAIQRLEGKWKLLLVAHMAVAGRALRFSELERAMPSITQRMLISSLRDLEGENFIERVVLSTTPLHVEYRLAKDGNFPEAAIAELLVWAERPGRTTAGGAAHYAGSLE